MLADRKQAESVMKYNLFCNVYMYTLQTMMDSRPPPPSNYDCNAQINYN